MNSPNPNCEAAPSPCAEPQGKEAGMALLHLGGTGAPREGEMREQSLEPWAETAAGACEQWGSMLAIRIF